MTKLIIFDFDDTLCLTEEACFGLENSVAEDMGFSKMSREAHRKNWGQPLETAIVERVPGIDVEEFLRRITERTPQYLADGKIDVIPDPNLRILDQLIEHGYKIAILTSRTYREVHHLLEEKHPLNRRIEKIYHKDISDFTKPDPRVFTKPLEEFGIKPEEAVYIGDAVSDAVAANGAGVRFIAMLESGIKTEDDFKGCTVDAFFRSFGEIEDYFIK